jgi:hypothetical protein
VVNAIMSRGEIRPLEPLPADWREGQSLQIEKADDSEMPVEEIDADFVILATLCSDSEPADEDQLERARHDAHSQAKDQVRRQRNPDTHKLVGLSNRPAHPYSKFRSSLRPTESRRPSCLRDLLMREVERLALSMSRRRRAAS